MNTPIRRLISVLGILLLRSFSSCFSAVLTAQNSGDWNSSNTWLGSSVPQNGDSVVIPNNRTVTLTSSTADLAGVHVQGELVASRSSTAQITMKTKYLVADGGVIDFGRSSTDAVLGELTVELTGNNPAEDFLGLGTKVFGATNGGEIYLHGVSKRSWTQLSGTFNAGSTWIRVLNNDGWSVGDQIVIASSGFNMNEAEVRTITNIRGLLGTVLDLDAPLDYKHFGDVQNYIHPDDPTISWSYDARAEVGMLSHNITIQGDASSASNGFGGHMMAMGGSLMKAEYVTLYRMGQRGVLGRYPWHWHALGNGGAGQYLRKSVVYESYNRAVTVHATNNTSVTDNLAYDHLGHGFFFEDGVEVNNVMTGNLGLVTRRPTAAEAILPSDIDNERNMSGPATFWISHPVNQVTNNHAAGSDGSGIWLAPHQNPNGPAYQAGLEPNHILLPNGYLDNNTVHSSNHGLLVGPTVRNSNPSQAVENGWGYLREAPAGLEPTIRNYTLYKNGLGAYQRVSNRSHWENFIVADNIKGEAVTWASTYDKFLWVGASANYEPVPTNANINTDIGGGGRVHAHTIYDGPNQITNSYFTDFDQPGMSLFDQWGATLKSPGHTLENTPAASGSIIDFRVSNPGPSWQYAVIYDMDGKITNRPGSAIHANYPMLKNTTSVEYPNGYNSAHTLERFVYVEATTEAPRQRPYLVRSDSEVLYDVWMENDGFGFQVAADGAYMYELLWEDNQPWITDFSVTGIDEGEYIIVGVKGVFPASYAQIFENGSFTGLPEVGTLADLHNYNGNASTYIEGVAEGTRYIRYEAPIGSDFRDTAKQLFRIQNPHGASTYSDTDGDTYNDPFEQLIAGTDIDSLDFDFFFDSTGVNLGWGTGGAVQSAIPNGSFYAIKASGSDPFIERNGYSFYGADMPLIKVTYNSTTTGRLRLRWKTLSGLVYSQNTVDALDFYSTASGAIATTYFNLRNDPNWMNETITDIRIDVFGGSNNVTRIYSIEKFDTSSNGVQGGVIVTDSDSDNLSDEWEIFYFGSLQNNGSGDADGDGISNLNEFNNSTDPLTTMADVIVTADNSYTLHHNNQLVGSGSTWNVAQVYSIPLVDGTNAITVEAYDSGGVAGMLLDMVVDGQSIISDASWKVNPIPLLGWKTANYNDSGWIQATEHGAYGVAPWNTNVVNMPGNTSAKWIWRADQTNDNQAFFRFAFDLVDPNYANYNYVNNPSFERDFAGGWVTSGPNPGADTIETDVSPRFGSKNLLHKGTFLGPVYQVETSQTVTSLANGTYRAAVWVKSSGNQNVCELRVRDYGGSLLSTSVPGTSTYQRIEITNIQVTNGQCTIALYTDCSANGGWATFDDVELLLQQ